MVWIIAYGIYIFIQILFGFKPTIYPLPVSGARAARFIEMVKSLRLPRVRIAQGTGLAQYLMLDDSGYIVVVSQTKVDIPEWTFPSFWKLRFVPISQVEVGGILIVFPPPPPE